jgi:hypothetical protein
MADIDRRLNLWAAWTPRRAPTSPAKQPSPAVAAVLVSLELKLMAGRKWAAESAAPRKAELRSNPVIRDTSKYRRIPTR